MRHALNNIALFFSPQNAISRLFFKFHLEIKFGGQLPGPHTGEKLWRPSSDPTLKSSFSLLNVRVAIAPASPGLLSESPRAGHARLCTVRW